MNDQTLNAVPRRSMLGATLAIAIIATLFAVPVRYAAAQQTRAVARSLGPTIDVVEVDGQAAVVRSATGGDLQGQVVTFATTDDLVGDKRLASLITTPLTMEWDLSPPLGEWIAQTLDNAFFIPKTLTLSSVDSQGNFVARKLFDDAVLAGIAFPALDRSKTEPGNIALRVLAPSVRYQSGGNLNAVFACCQAVAGPMIEAPSVRYQSGGRLTIPSGASKAWLSRDFQIEIGDLPTQRISRVEPFTWTLQVAEQQVGEFRTQVSTSGRVNIDNLKLVISAGDFNQWRDWMDSFLIRGDSGPDAEKSGFLRLVSGDLQQVLLELQLQGIGLVSMTLPKVDADTGAATFTAEIYVEQIRLLGY